MKDREWQRNERAILPDGRQGIVYGLVYPGGGGETILTLMTDDYTKVDCPASLAMPAKRQGETVSYDGARVHPIEAENMEKLHRAIWHSHWQEHGGSIGAIESGPLGEYWRAYQRGEIVPLPKHEDLRQPAQEPERPYAGAIGRHDSEYEGEPMEETLEETERDAVTTWADIRAIRHALPRGLDPENGKPWKHASRKAALETEVWVLEGKLDDILAEVANAAGDDAAGLMRGRVMGDLLPAVMDYAHEHGLLPPETVEETAEIITHAANHPDYEGAARVVELDARLGFGIQLMEPEAVTLMEGQLDIFGQLHREAIEDRGEQLLLFAGQGPGGSLALPNGEAIKDRKGREQATLPLAGRLL